MEYYHSHHFKHPHAHLLHPSYVETLVPSPHALALHRHAMASETFKIHHTVLSPFSYSSSHIHAFSALA